MPFESRSYHDDYIPEASKEGLQRIQEGAAHIKPSSETQAAQTEELQRAKAITISTESQSEATQLAREIKERSLTDRILIKETSKQISSELLENHSNIQRSTDYSNGSGSILEVFESNAGGGTSTINIFSALQNNLQGANLKVYDENSRYSGKTINKSETCYFASQHTPNTKSKPSGSNNMLLIAVADASGNFIGYSAAHCLSFTNPETINEVSQEEKTTHLEGLQSNNPLVQSQIASLLTQREINPLELVQITKLAEQHPENFNEICLNLQRISSKTPTLQRDCAGLIKRIHSLNARSSSQEISSSLQDAQNFIEENTITQKDIEARRLHNEQLLNTASTGLEKTYQSLQYFKATKDTKPAQIIKSAISNFHLNKELSNIGFTINTVRKALEQTIEFRITRPTKKIIEQVLQSLPHNLEDTGGLREDLLEGF